MRYFLVVLLLAGIPVHLQAQHVYAFVDSVRNHYRVPEIAYAVVTADAIPEMGATGSRRTDQNQPARPDDQFHIGSNTKAITCFLAALLVQEGKIGWNTRFFDLFPELKMHSRKVYHTLSLQDLLTFRGKLPRYTYTFKKPAPEQITGNEAQQRYELAKYFVAQRPMAEEDGLTPSNVDYILAGLMLEKASGKSYRTLVTDFGLAQNIRFGFGYPNLADSLQTWGHDALLKPQPPIENPKMNWLLCAGNLHLTVFDYARFLQLQLQGLAGQSALLPPSEFEKLIFGLPHFSYGWFNHTDPATGYTVATNTGNAGAFITRVDIVKETGMGFVVFTNAYTPETSRCIQIIMEHLKKTYHS